VLGDSSSGTGCRGITRTTGQIAVHGTQVTGDSQNYGGYFQGNVYVTGYLTKAGGGFRIDHPLQPESKILNHFFVESSEMKNMYDGVAVLDSGGEATVTLPAWFDAANGDVRYQLTPLGGPAPNLHVKDRGVRAFTIAGGEPGQQVCWQVTGVRVDAWARQARRPVEEDKVEHERGYYLHPSAHGMALDKGIEWRKLAAEGLV
jgi:hypothetical protein